MISRVGSAMRARDAGSVTDVRATITPIAAAPTVKGSEKPSMPMSGLTSTRPSARLMTPKMHRAAVTVAAAIATSCPTHDQVWPSGPARRWKTRTATQAARANWATLKTSLSPRWRRWITRAAPVPSTWASTRSDGTARTRPAASTRSLAENVCTSRFHWTCTTSTSLAAKSAAHSTHGRVTAVGAADKGATTMTNSVTAAAATAPVSSAIRWDGPSRSTLRRPKGPPFVIVVVMPSAPADPGPGQPGPGQPGPGQARPGQPAPAQAGPGQPGPGQPAPAETGPGQPAPGQARPGQPGPGQARPGQPGPGQPGERG